MCECVTTTRVNVAQCEPGALEAVEQCLPRLRPGHARIDERVAALVLQRVAVDVTQARHVERQLHAQDARRDLGDVRRRLFCFLPWHAMHAIDPLVETANPRPLRVMVVAAAEDLVAVVTQLRDALADVVEGSVGAALSGALASTPGYHRRTSSLMVDTSTER